MAVLADLEILVSALAVLVVLGTMVQTDPAGLGTTVLGVQVVSGKWVQFAPVVLVTTVLPEAAVALGILQVVLAALEMINMIITMMGTGLFDFVKW